jgi:hypothetical protein
MVQTLLQPPAGVELSALLTLRGRRAAHEWIAETLGVPVKFNYVRECIYSNEIPHTKVAGVAYFSTQDLFNWASRLGGGPGDRGWV